jgi:hypothetical protein
MPGYRCGQPPRNKGLLYRPIPEGRGDRCRDALRRRDDAWAPFVRWDFYGCRTSEVITLRPSSNVVASHGSVLAHYNNMVAVVVEVLLAESSATAIAEQLWIQLERLAGARPMF